MDMSAKPTALSSLLLTWLAKLDCRGFSLILSLLFSPLWGSKVGEGVPAVLAAADVGVVAVLAGSPSLLGTGSAVATALTSLTVLPALSVAAARSPTHFAVVCIGEIS
jgi:hypothetical protein